MLRASRFCLGAGARSSRCLYDVLGVAPTATTEELKSAFRERAVETHPDTAAGVGSTQSQRFRELLDAYRILRDPAKRAEYDSGEAQPGAAAAARGPPGFGGGGASAPSGEGAADVRPVAHGHEKVAVGAVVLGAVLLFWRESLSGPAFYRDPDPYPRRLVAAGSTTGAAAAAAAPAAAAASSGGGAAWAAVERAGDLVAVGASSGAGAGLGVAEEGKLANERVRAFFDPFANHWQRLPDGFLPPSSMDLTAFHKKRTDQAEWARLFAEGTLERLIPRGGLKVRYVPYWETFEPVLLGDPVTGKTSFAHKLVSTKPPVEETCEVRF